VPDNPYQPPTPVPPPPKPPQRSRVHVLGVWVGVMGVAQVAAALAGFAIGDTVGGVALLLAGIAFAAVGGLVIVAAYVLRR
jgi:hypothetical protein